MELTLEKASIIMMALDSHTAVLKERIECFEDAIKEGQYVERFTASLNRSKDNLIKTQELLKEINEYVETGIY